MTNSVRNVVKSSKLGAVTQCGSHGFLIFSIKKQSARCGSTVTTREYIGPLYWEHILVLPYITVFP